MAKTPSTPKTTATPSASPQAPAAAATGQGGAALSSQIPAGDAPRVTADQNAPVDPLIKGASEALRADAAASTARPADQGEAAAGETKTGTAPVTGLGDAAQGRSSPFPDAAFGADAVPAGARLNPQPGWPAGERPLEEAPPRIYKDFSEANDPAAIRVRVMGVAGDLVELGFYDLAGFLDAGSKLAALEAAVARPGMHDLYFFDRNGYEHVNTVEAGPAGSRPTVRLVHPEPRPLNAADALLVIGSSVGERLAQADVSAPARYIELGPISPLAPDEVPPAAPAVQPTAVVDPAFLRVAASALIVKAVAGVITVNTEIRAEPGHDYGVRYVDVAGVPRIVRVEAFVGPTATLELAADVGAPLVGSEIQIGVLGAPIDIETGHALVAGKYLSLRELGDGTAMAVTVDGRKVRVGAL